MTQTQQNKPGQSLGAAAAAAAAATGASAQAKPSDGKPAEAKPADAKDGAKPDEPAGKKKREAKRKVFVVIGEVREFESIVQAEKHLNGAEAPTGEYSVLHGVRTRMSKRVSLR